MSLTLQNDNDDSDPIVDETEQTQNNLEHQRRVRELLFDHNNDLFDILMKILPSVSGNELDFIEMILPWYESYIFFEHSYIDSTLDEKFLYFYQQMMQCLKSDEYKRSLVINRQSSNDDYNSSTSILFRYMYNGNGCTC